MTLTVYRKSEDRRFELELKRGVVPIKSVAAHYMLEGDIGYLKVNRFAESTYDEFKTALLH